jgi:Na+-transporting NADH:ubiquinone oxidoreductase subunit F
MEIPKMDEKTTGAIFVNDYSLVGKNSTLAVQKGLAEAKWYSSPIPKAKMRELLERRDGPAIRDTVIWFALLFFFGACGYLTWGTGWAVIPFALYGVIYASTSDSRWHESSHGTAFKTDWMNNVLYEIASFMVLRESTVWRWSHTRHHSDTIIVGRDPEIAVPRPPKIPVLISSFFNYFAFRKYWSTVIRHCTGRLTPEEKTFIPDSAVGSITIRAWIYVVIYFAVLATAIIMRSLLPLMYIGLPTFYGAWLMVIYGYTQHAGLAEDVLDHRLNCRTVHMNRLNRYLYWNMNYHVEHHMFPLVPYHALPKLHELVKADCPPAYGSIRAAYQEIIPTLLRQSKDPTFFVRRPLPPPTVPLGWTEASPVFSAKGDPDPNGWVEVCSSDLVRKEDVIRFDHEQSSYAIYRTAKNDLFATDGICSHGNAHLADGMVKGTLIECPKHNGRFDVRDGSPQRLPVCIGIKTYSVREADGRIFFNLNSAGGSGMAQPIQTYTFQVVSNKNVATFIKELILEPEASSPRLEYQPGDYLQFNIPVFSEQTLEKIAVDDPFMETWRKEAVFSYTASNPMPCRRNYSIASDPAEKDLRFNIRISLPPHGIQCHAGTGSAYLFGLKPGDRVSAIGPSGTFHIQESDREMIYIGGGAGMAPLRAHITHLLEGQNSKRKISYWYGGRSRKELFYQDYFEDLERRFSNFSFQVALSDPLPDDDWKSFTGFIHEVVNKQYLSKHPDPKSVDYYLCGPPAMVLATKNMLTSFGVPPSQISYDEF